ncbi:hypothetical protein [Archangium sp.]|uniref:hypothetical protein n=1 Tax=Archangium sp. TaxID=1872627 RepID=UPI002D5A5DB4|nr:hypothetical protein [Archangium sp.]HYO53969.1 hypothetical protein [Archangium sp.]
MLSALSVLALLLSADGTQDKKESPVEVTALAVDVDFVCRTPTTQSLILIPKAQGQLEVPRDCPDARADWRLSVDCGSQSCSGDIRTRDGAIALIQGTRKQLTVKPIAPQHPSTLDFLAVRITGQHSLKLETPKEHQPPVQLLLQLPAVTGVYTLAPSEPEPASLDFEHQGRRLTLRALASRTDATHVHLQLWNVRRELLLDATLEMDKPRELDCQRLDGICEGSMKLWVREYQRVL